MHLQNLLALILIFLFCIIGTMAENQNRLKHNRVSQHAFVCRERAICSGPRFSANSFDAEALTSHAVCLKLHKVACLIIRTLEGARFLLTLRLMKSLKPYKRNLLRTIPILIVFQDPLVTPPYILSMNNMLLGTRGKDKHIIYFYVTYVSY